MSRSKKNEALVGTFALIGTGLFVLLIFLMGGLDGLLHDQRLLTTTFRDAEGLQVGDPVYVFGVKCGKVISLSIEDDRDGASVVVATLAMPSEFRERIRTTSEVSIEKTLTGNLSVLIKQDQSDPGVYVADGVPLDGAPTTGLTAVAEDASAALRVAKEAIASLHGLIEEIRTEGDVQKTLANVARLSDEIREALTPLTDSLESRLVELSELSKSVRDTIEENRPEIRTTLASLSEGATAANKLLTRLESTPEELNASLKVVRSAAEKADGILGDNRIHLDSILADLDTTMGNAANLTSEVKRRPWRLLYQPSIEEQKELELYDAAWAYNLATSELHRSARDLAAHMERATDGGSSEEGVALREALERVRESLRREKEAEEHFWRRLEAEPK